MKSLSPCRNTNDPISLEPLGNQVIEIGEGPKKNCYDPMTLFYLYKQSIETNRPFRDPLNPAYTISSTEIQTLIHLVKRQMGRKYRPPIPPPRPRYANVAFTIQPENIEWNQILLDRAILGYFPNSPNSLKDEYKDKLIQLWNRNRLLEDSIDRQGQVIGYRIAVPIIKSREFWKDTQKTRNEKFMELLEEANKYL